MMFMGSSSSRLDMRVEVGRVRHYECTESRCGDWHGRSHCGAEDTSVCILWDPSLNTVEEEGESYPKWEKTWPYSGRSVSGTKGRKFQKEGRKSGKSGECFDCICLQFHLSVVDSGNRPPIYSKCNESSFQGSLHFCIYLNTCLKRDWRETH